MKARAQLISPFGWCCLAGILAPLAGIAAAVIARWLA
jgi:hypothetical protein